MKLMSRSLIENKMGAKRADEVQVGDIVLCKRVWCEVVDVKHHKHRGPSRHLCLISQDDDKIYSVWAVRNGMMIGVK